MRRHMPDREDNPDPGQADTPHKFSCLEKQKNAAHFGDVAMKKCLTQRPRLDNTGIDDSAVGFWGHFLSQLNSCDFRCHKYLFLLV